MGFIQYKAVGPHACFLHNKQHCICIALLILIYYYDWEYPGDYPGVVVQGCKPF